MNNSVGWIRLSRNIVDMDGYFGEKFTRAQCWIDLLLLSEWLPERSFYIRGNKVTVKRGQVAISIRELSERWHLSINTVQSRLKEFVLKERIDIQKSNVINIISIINYEKYQSIDTQNDTQIDMQNDTQIDTPYKNINNINNIHTHIYAREKEKISAKEQWRIELEKDNLFWEQSAMSFRCPVQWIKELLPIFHAENIACELNESSFNDYRRDFFNFVRRENQKRLRDANKNKQHDNSRGRSGGSSASIGGHGLNE